VEKTHRSINKWVDQRKHRAIASRGKVKPRKLTMKNGLELSGLALDQIMIYNRP